MRKSLRQKLASSTFITGAVYWFFGELLKELFFGMLGNNIKVASMTFDVDAIFGLLVQYGPPIILVTIGIYLLLPESWKTKKEENKHAKQRGQELLHEKPKTDYISLSDVARRAYEKHRIGDQYYLDAAYFDEGFANVNESQSDVLNSIAMSIALTGIDLYGKYPPSNVYERIPSRVENTYVFRDNGNSLHPMGSEQPDYIDVSINKSDVDNALAGINNYTPLPDDIRERFVLAFTRTLIELTPEIIGETDAFKILKNEYQKHLNAVIEIKEYLNGNKRTEFIRAWEIYCCKNGTPFLEQYSKHGCSVSEKNARIALATERLKKLLEIINGQR